MSYPVTANLTPGGRDPTDFRRVLYHAGKSCTVLHRWRQLLRTASPRGWPAVRAHAPRVMELTSDPRVLHTAAVLLRSGGPKAAGPNGLRLEELAEDEAVATVHRAGPGGPHGRVPAGRPAGRVGAESLREGAAADRRGGRAGPGRREGRRAQAVAVAERLTLDGHPFWLTHDLADAYRRVPVPRLLDVVFKLLPCPRLRAFLTRVLPPRAPGLGGLKQGGPLSPLGLEVYLSHFADRPWRKAGHPARVVRYADDFLVVAADAAAAKAADSALRGLLTPAAMLPKEPFEEAVTDLREGLAEWLGFRFSLDGTDLRVRLPENACE